jgi:hypothetical protein
LYAVRDNKSNAEEPGRTERALSLPS